MKHFLPILLITLSFQGFSQSKKEQIETLQQENGELKKKVTTIEEDINHLLDANKSTEQIVNTLQYENAELRNIMRGYVYEMDSLNTALRVCHDELGDVYREQGYVDPDAHNGFELKEEVKTSNTSNAPPVGSPNDNPFGSGGDGQNSGDGAAYGSGDGPGTGDGAGGTHRRIVKNVHVNIKYDYPVRMTFKITINADGKVLAAQVVRGQTSTTDQVLINKMIKAVKEQVRYSEEPGAPLTTTMYKLMLKPR